MSSPVSSVAPRDSVSRCEEVSAATTLSEAPSAPPVVAAGDLCGLGFAQAEVCELLRANTRLWECYYRAFAVAKTGVVGAGLELDKPGAVETAVETPPAPRRRRRRRRVRRVAPEVPVEETVVLTPSVASRGSAGVPLAIELSGDFVARKEAAIARWRAEGGGDGYCYLWAVCEHSIDAVAGTLGPLASLTHLVDIPRGWFESYQVLRSLGVSSVAEGVYHVQGHLEGSETNLLTMMRSLQLLDIDPGSLAEELMGFSPCQFPCSLSDRLGADLGAQVCGVLAELVAGADADVPAEVAKMVSVGGGEVMSASAGLDDRGKTRQRVVQGVGDAVLTLVLAERFSWVGGSVQALQEARSLVTSNARLSTTLLASPFAAFVPETLRGSVRVVGGYLEGLLGVAYLWGGVVAARSLCDELRVFEGTAVLHVDDGLGVAPPGAAPSTGWAAVEAVQEGCWPTAVSDLRRFGWMDGARVAAGTTAAVAAVLDHYGTGRRLRVRDLWEVVGGRSVFEAGPGGPDGLMAAVRDAAVVRL